MAKRTLSVCLVSTPSATIPLSQTDAFIVVQNGVAKQVPQSAMTASHASTADNATNATNATNAVNATNAENAVQSANADQLAECTLAEIKLLIKRELNPIGTIYENASDPTNPATLLGFGTWAALAPGRVLVGSGGGYTAGQTGGEANHTLSINEMPSHTHDYFSVGPGSGLFAGANYSNVATISGSAGGGAAHNNMQPYLVVYRWVRTA